VKPVKYIADHLRQVLINGASAPHTEEVQRFFKEEIKSRGWYTDEIRKLAKRLSRTIANGEGVDYLFAVADDLFNGDVLEEKVLAVFLLQERVSELNEKHFRQLVRWLPRVSSWADHDGLASFLLGPMMVREPKRVAWALKWTRSRDRWHRRAAAVSLIRGVRQKKFARETRFVTSALLADKDDMVQKGLGWLLREQAKYDRERAMPLLRSIRKKAPRLVLRTACETLPENLRVEILDQKPQKAKA
jgi:3-methyladenine DNA glycosylase AlkD